MLTNCSHSTLIAAVCGSAGIRRLIEEATAIICTFNLPANRPKLTLGPCRTNNLEVS